MLHAFRTATTALWLFIFIVISGLFGHPAAAETGRLTVTFEYKGQPARGSLIVSDGDYREAWVNVEKISATVPSRATYIFDLKPPDDTQPIPVTFRDILPEFVVPEGGERNIIVTILPHELPRPFDPVILIRDADAKVRVTNRLETYSDQPGRRTLTSIIERSPGTLAILDGIYASNASDRDTIRDFTCSGGCPHLFGEPDCSVHCYQCSTTCTTPAGWWKANGNMCSDIVATTPSDPAVSDWEELPFGVGGIQLAVATRNDGAIRPIRSALTGAGVDVRLVPPYKARSFPDFTAPVGEYLYTVAFDETAVPGGYGLQEVVLPVSVRDGRIANMIVRMPMSDADLSQPFAIADNRIGAVLREETFDMDENGVTLRISSPDPDPGAIWYAVALPRDADPEAVEVTRDGDALTRGSAFVTGELMGKQVVVVRSEGMRDALEVRWVQN